MIRTTSKRSNGHWRGGQFHHASGSEFHDDTFTDEQRDQLEADPDLIVEEREGEPSGQPPARALPRGGSGEDDEYLERKVALDERERALSEREKALSERAADLEALSARIDGTMQDEAFRAVALRYGIARVIEGKAPADFTKSGLPTTEAITREALGIECSAKERDALFAELNPPA